MQNSDGTRPKIKNKNKLDQFDDETLEKAKRYAFLFGVFGAHDFLLKRWARGVLHIILWVIPLLFYNPLGVEICKNLGECQGNAQTNTFYTTTICMFVVMAIASYAWAAMEGDGISNAIHRRTPEYKKEMEEAEKNAKPPREQAKEYLIEAKDYFTQARRYFVAALAFIICALLPIVFLFISLQNKSIDGEDAFVITAVMWPIMLILALAGVGMLIAAAIQASSGAKSTKLAKKLSKQLYTNRLRFLAMASFISAIQRLTISR